MTIALALGLLLPQPSLAPDTANYHLRKVRQHIYYCSNPKNFERQGGYLMLDPSASGIDQDYHLKKLVKMGAVTKKTFTYPHLKNTRMNTLHWMQFTHNQLEILDAIAPAGDGPGEEQLSFTLHYTWLAKDKVEELDQYFRQLEY